MAKSVTTVNGYNVQWQTAIVDQGITMIFQPIVTEQLTQDPMDISPVLLFFGDTSKATLAHSQALANHGVLSRENMEK